MKFAAKILVFECKNVSMIQNFIEEFTRERRCLAISIDAFGFAVLRALSDISVINLSLSARNTVT